MVPYAVWMKAMDEWKVLRAHSRRKVETRQERNASTVVEICKNNPRNIYNSFLIIGGSDNIRWGYSIPPFRNIPKKQEIFYLTFSYFFQFQFQFL